MMKKFGKWAMKNKMAGDMVLGFVTIALVGISGLLLHEAEKEGISTITKIVTRISTL